MGFVSRFFFNYNICFVVAVCDLVHDANTMHALFSLLTRAPLIFRKICPGAVISYDGET